MLGLMVLDDVTCISSPSLLFSILLSLLSLLGTACLNLDGERSSTSVSDSWCGSSLGRLVGDGDSTSIASLEFMMYVMR